ncbi:hypothetical protein IAQ61_005740 [Plenodomus lingam]|uniref:uncharacterized protein n=1 Tax=Leptosphaeria maculans TaxID=5022 RepID=UPI00332732D0|nr:hypothetical protein IAQ61_005740 [Plenodomus lingam]
MASRSVVPLATDLHHSSSLASAGRLPGAHATFTSSLERLRDIMSARLKFDFGRRSRNASSDWEPASSRVKMPRLMNRNTTLGSFISGSRKALMATGVLSASNTNISYSVSGLSSVLIRSGRRA